MRITITSIALLVGFFGDALIQLIVRFVPISVRGNWGLIEYFAKHGSIESMCIAGGLMAVLYIIYLDVLRLPLNYLFLALFGVVADLAFRWFRIFPTLDDYYAHLNYFWTAFWGAFPMILPLFIKQKLT